MSALASVVPLAFAGAASASESTCLERWARHYVGVPQTERFQYETEQTIKNGPTMRTVFRQIDSTHWMTEAVDPDSLAWTLSHSGTMFTSSDKGKTWSVLRTIDEAENAAGRKRYEEQAKSATDAICDQETVDGVTYERLAANFMSEIGLKTQNRFTYWVDEATGQVMISRYETEAESFSSVTVQRRVAFDMDDLPRPTSN
ncbi:MAG: hypothetical protein AAFY73_08145 [Pseudomonadota bacterium]